MPLREVRNAPAMNGRPLYPQRRRSLTPPAGRSPFRPVLCQEECVAVALAVVSAAVSAAAMLVVMSLTTLVISLAFRADRSAHSQRRTKDL